MIQLAMTPEQFATARAAILSSAQVLQHAEATETDGSFATAQVTIDYSYANGELLLDVTAKRGMAHFASDAEIQEHIQDLLAKV